MNESGTVFEYKITPTKQAFIAFALILSFSLVIKLGQFSGILPSTYLIIWVVSASFLLLFGMFNSLLCISSDSIGQYWSRSIFSYAALAVLSALSAWSFTKVSIEDAATFKWLYLVVTIGYLVFLSIVGFIKIIIDIAKKKDTRDFSKRNYWK